MSTMPAVFLPGGREVVLADVPRPTPGHGQILLRMRASSICGSDLRAIYREHLGTGPEAYTGVVAGHEPAGEVVEVGPGCKLFRPGDRVIVYHIAGCGLCPDCRAGYMISCTSPLRAAYGWQRDGGHAELLVADESTCIALPDALSFLDGACVACGFGTAYEALRRVAVSGRDAVLVTGLGPLGLAVGLLAKALGAGPVVGVEGAGARRELARAVGAVDVALAPGEETVAQVAEATGSRGCEVAVDCSGSAGGRATALAGTRRWGRVALVGEGGRLEIDASPALIHRQVTLMGSWVTSLGHMEELMGLLVRWDLHPDRTVTDRFPLDEAASAYATADVGAGGKVAIIP